MGGVEGRDDGTTGDQEEKHWEGAREGWGQGKLACLCWEILGTS